MLHLVALLFIYYEIFWVPDRDATSRVFFFFLLDGFKKPGEGSGNDPDGSARLVTSNHGVALAEVSVAEAEENPVGAGEDSLQHFAQCARAELRLPILIREQAVKREHLGCRNVKEPLGFIFLVF